MRSREQAARCQRADRGSEGRRLADGQTDRPSRDGWRPTDLDALAVREDRAAQGMLRPHILLRQGGTQGGDRIEPFEGQRWHGLPGPGAAALDADLAGSVDHDLGGGGIGQGPSDRRQQQPKRGFARAAHGMDLSLSVIGEVATARIW